MKFGPIWRLRMGGGVVVKATAFSLGLSFLSLPWSGVARADDYDDANRQLMQLDEEVRRLSSNFREEAPPQANIAERRLVDAQTLFELGNYAEASTLLFDIIERYPNTRVYDEALVLMGECLFLTRDLLGARRYFVKSLDRNTNSRFEQQALQRLIEIALKTGDFEGVDKYLERLASVPMDRLEPSVPYVRGKYLFFRDRLDDAEAAMNSLPSSNPYYLQSRYFVATIYVKRGDLAAATSAFDAVLKIQPRTEEDREIQDLARLALGRLYYERSQFDQAKAMYASIDRRSKYFADAMYESAWTAIKANDFKTAYRALDLMLLQAPDSPRAPELRLLMGNLNLRMGNYFLASDTFGNTRDQFEPIHRDLVQTLERAKTDPDYFQNLIGQDLSKFDLEAFVPASAAKWVEGEPEVERVTVLASDVGEIRKGIEEADDLLVRLDAAVNGQGKVAIFPDLADVRTGTSEVLNQTVDIRKKFAGQLRTVADKYISGEDKEMLRRHEDERSALEESLKDVPLTAEALKKRDVGTKGELGGLDGQTSEINVLIQGLEAELVAIENYYKSSQAEQKIPPEDVKAQVKQIRETIDELRARNAGLRTEIEDATRQNTAAGAAGEGERYAVVRLSDLIGAEQRIYGQAREKMSGDDRVRFDKIVAVLSRANDVQQRTVSLDERIDAAAEKRLVGIRGSIETEREALKASGDKLASMTNESQGVGGGLAQTLVERVRDRFYELVVQSDVGLVDVSWGLKDERTSKLNTLITQQKNEMKALDEDFREILQDDKQ